jgi:hypothetical protein
MEILFPGREGESKIHTWTGQYNKELSAVYGNFYLHYTFQLMQGKVLFAITHMCYFPCKRRLRHLFILDKTIPLDQFPNQFCLQYLDERNWFGLLSSCSSVVNLARQSLDTNIRTEIFSPRLMEVCSSVHCVYVMFSKNLKGSIPLRKWEL